MHAILCKDLEGYNPFARSFFHIKIWFNNYIHQNCTGCSEKKVKLNKGNEINKDDEQGKTRSCRERERKEKNHEKFELSVKCKRTHTHGNVLYHYTNARL